MTAPPPSPKEQAVIRRFGIFDPEEIAEDLLPWAPEDAAGLRYRQQRIAEALAEAEAQGFARGRAVWS